jgi:hypothetical protein
MNWRILAQRIIGGIIFVFGANQTASQIGGAATASLLIMILGLFIVAGIAFPKIPRKKTNNSKTTDHTEA